jgi:hypothetical protein
MCGAKSPQYGLVTPRFEFDWVARLVATTSRAGSGLLNRLRRERRELKPKLEALAQGQQAILIPSWEDTFPLNPGLCRNSVVRAEGLEPPREQHTGT